MRTFFAVAFAVALLVTGSAFADSGLVNLGGGLVDLNDDGSVDGADGAILAGGIEADVVGPGEIIVQYDPTTGNVYTSQNNIGSLRIVSPTNALITGAAVGAGAMGGSFHDDTAIEINYTGFPLATENSFLIGHILGTGLADSSQQYLPANVASLLFTIFANPDSIDTPASIVNLGFVPVPEPSSLILAGLAGIGMLFFARRRRVAA